MTSPLERIASLRVRSHRTLDHPAWPLSAAQLAARDAVLHRYDNGDLLTEQASCLCGASDALTLVDRDRYGLPAPNVMCRSCGIVRSTPRLSPDSLTSFYEHDYRELYSGSRTASSDFFTSMVAMGQRLRVYLHTQGVYAPAKVADVGCGAGGLLLPLRDAGYEVAGCDLGAEYLESGRSYGLDLRHGSYDVLADLAPFDLIILSHVLEHIADVSAFLSGLQSLLTSDGLLYVELPGLYSIGHSYGDPLRYFQNAHLWSFDLSSLQRVMGNNGWTLAAGDEGIRSLFRLSGISDPMSTGSSFSTNLLMLAKAERCRTVNGQLLRLRQLRYFPSRERLRHVPRRLARSLTKPDSTTDPKCP